MPPIFPEPPKKRSRAQRFRDYTIGGGLADAMTDDFIEVGRQLPRGFYEIGKARTLDTRDAALRMSNLQREVGPITEDGFQFSDLPQIANLYKTTLSDTLLGRRTKKLAVETGKETVRQTAADLRHPLRNPGRTVLSVLGLGGGAVGAAQTARLARTAPGTYKATREASAAAARKLPRTVRPRVVDRAGRAFVRPHRSGMDLDTRFSRELPRMVRAKRRELQAAPMRAALGLEPLPKPKPNKERARAIARVTVRPSQAKLVAASGTVRHGESAERAHESEAYQAHLRKLDARRRPKVAERRGGR